MELKKKLNILHILNEINPGRHPNKGCGWTTILIVAQPRVSFHIDKTNNYCISKKMNSFLDFEMITFPSCTMKL